MQNRTVIDHVQPQINQGRFPIKRVVGEWVDITASIIGDGHDKIRAKIQFRQVGKKKWQEVELKDHPNDLWTGRFQITEQKHHQYRLMAWVDQLFTWHEGFKKKQADGQDMTVELQIGVNLLESTAKTYSKAKGGPLKSAATVLGGEYDSAVRYVVSPDFADLVNRFPFVQHETVYDHDLRVSVGRLKERYSSWYELFPRSASPDIDRTGTFKDVELLLPRIKKLGFDVLYLPPVHPVGEKNRKGRNNATNAQPGEPGSPWAIGSSKGGHKDLNPELGTLKDYKSLIKKAKSMDIDLALDLAFQCAPDHPYIEEHPEWFIWRPDGTIAYAENPPKKYQDIVPINFETADWKNLWDELLSVVRYWCEQGITIFRVDNPHTKPYRFWEWLISEVNKKYPGTIFLAEAFTRPKIMAELAKRGFQQSYTYFTWRTNPQEMRQYLEELTQTELKEYMRPNFWPNTPDILAFEMMGADSNQFLKRLILAATLSSSYGLYGPSYELIENRGNTNGKEEYYDSEKYYARHYDWTYENRMTNAYTLINKIRRENPALQQTNNIRFTETDNPNLLSYVKYDDKRTNVIWTIANFDPANGQGGMVSVPRDLLGSGTIVVDDLLTGESYRWNGQANYVYLDPNRWPAHVLRLRF